MNRLNRVIHGAMRQLIWFVLVSPMCGTALSASGSQLPAPDYQQPGAWAAFPGHASHALDTPAGVSVETNPAADVFFIHPTTDLSLGISNAPFDDRGSAGERLDDLVMRFQASVFNGCCRIYAPRYRQASLGAITTNSAQAYAADELAYGDVSRAFDEFLKQNGQRPFIIASHSQGSNHAMRLLQERVIGTPLAKRLVAAYLIGGSIPESIADLGMPVCRDDTATSCVLSWNSVRRGHNDSHRQNNAVVWWQGSYQAIGGRALVCVNPLTWRPGGAADANLNQGAIYSAGRDAPLPAPVAHLTGAWCEDGLLGVSIPFEQRRHFGDVLTLMGVYHDFDYTLFYMNLHENAASRVRAWAQANSK